MSVLRPRPFRIKPATGGLRGVADTYIKIASGRNNDAARQLAAQAGMGAQFVGDGGAFVEGGNGGPPLPDPDPFFADVELLLHMDGSDGSTTFVDSSQAMRTITVAGDAAIDTDISKWNDGSLELSGARSSANNINFAVDANLRWFPDTDFTIECWAYQTATNVIDGIISLGAGATSTEYLTMWSGTFQGYAVQFADGAAQWAVQDPAGSLSLDTWHHCAFTMERLSATDRRLRLYRDGSKVDEISRDGLGGTDADHTLGYVGRVHTTSDGNGPFLGRIEDVRITTGIARYTGNTYTVPAAPFPDM